MRVLIIQGSPRNVKNESGKDSKTLKLARYLMQLQLNNVELDLIDLSIKNDGIIVQPEKGLYSSAKTLPTWPDTQYGPLSQNPEIKDYFWEHDVYNRLTKADRILIMSPVHWWGPSSQLKAFFDRLINANGTMTLELAKKFYGKNLGSVELAATVEQQLDTSKVLKNHLAGKVAAFFSQGDDGADDYTKEPLPASAEIYKDFLSQPSEASIIPLVLQLAYSGVEVPTALIRGYVRGKGIAYSKNDATFTEKDELYAKVKQLLLDLISYKI